MLKEWWSDLKMDYMLFPFTTIAMHLMFLSAFGYICFNIYRCL